jgi:chemotaxis protein methyltransferase CheR
VTAPNAGDLPAFQELLARRLGLHFGEDKREMLIEILRQGLQDSASVDANAYFQALDLPGPDWDRLVASVTVGETFFFRQWDQFRALAETVLPERIKARSAERRLSILSAGCASGEEVYSLAMLLSSRFPGLEGWDLELKGVDINATSLVKAAEGVYTSWSLRDTPSDLWGRFFIPAGKDFKVVDAIRKRAIFEQRNLTLPNADLWLAGHYDVIFCRNMLMYLTVESASALVARMAAALAPGGFLFLGYAETLKGLSDEFRLCNTDEAFYHQHLLAKAGPQEGAKLAVAPDADPVSLAAPAIPRPADGRAGKSEAEPGATLDQAYEFARRGTFLGALGALPPSGLGGPDALLLRAVLLADLGRTMQAMDACRELLQMNMQAPAAHYVAALCREHEHDLNGAAEEDGQAIRMDAGFAMPWLHLGLMAQHSGNLDQARRCFDQALALLPQEEFSRVLLFSGGLGRDGLAQVCRNGQRMAEPRL